MVGSYMSQCKNYRVKLLHIIAFSLVLLLDLSTAPATQASSDAILPEGTRIALQLNDHLSTKQNNEGDLFTAVVMVPVYKDDQIVIPRGSVVSGSISRVIRPGRFKGKAVMNLLFHSVSIPGRGQFPITASLAGVDSHVRSDIYSESTMEGGGSIGRDTGKILTPGVVGAGIGAVAGGRRGAGIGAGVGTAIGLATVFATRGKDLEVRRGSTMDISLDRPLKLPLEAGDMAIGNRQ